MKDAVFYPLIGAVAIMSGVNVVDTLRPQSVSMALTALTYENGEFYQEHRIEGTDALRAEWAAKIVRGDTFLCVGGGASAYRSGGSPRMDPDRWTGDDCPELEPGDVATATWEYLDESNVRHRISGSIVIE